jgi:NADH-quinone oxidoreductase subunit L
VVVGTITMLMGAIIGLAKDDIKKALAGSTMSQIGYMILAVGLGPAGYVFALFHLFTHGMFKAGLFLGAGSVMHGMNDEVNMRRYGALRGAMVITFVTFGLAYLAIIGFPGFSGYFSKDEIIKVAFAVNPVIGACTLLAAGLTAFYMTRIMLMTFFGKARWAKDVHPHESPTPMTIPMIVLAFGSVLSGYILLYVANIESWLEPVVGFTNKIADAPGYVAPAIIAVIVAGAAGAYAQYGRQEIPVVAPAGNLFTKAARADLGGDAFNEAVFMRPGQHLTRILVWFDNRVIDGFVNGLAASIGGISGRSRRLQTGFARSYALTMLGGAAVVVGTLILVRL